MGGTQFIASARESQRGDAIYCVRSNALNDVFHCRCCGACCRIKDGIVRVSDAEIARISAFLGMDEAVFIERETELAPDRKSLVLKSLPDGSCAFLAPDNLCRINPVKPDKCRSFPREWTNPDSATVCPALAETRNSKL